MNTRACVCVVTLLVVLVVTCSCESVPPPPEGPPGLAPPKPSEGFQMAMSVEVPPGKEVWHCSIYDLPYNPTAPVFHVNRVHSQQTGGTHHMTISTLAFSDVDIDVGEYDCDDLYANNPELMSEMIMVYGSQDTDAELQLPDGVVATMPHQIRMMHEVHYVNATPDPITSWSTVNAYTIPGDDVTGSIWGFAVNDRNLTIPAGADTVEWTQCEMTEDVDMLFLSTHTHALGTRATISKGGEVVYENTDWHYPPLMTLDPPMHIPAGTIMELRCEFSNHRDVDVEWGFTADDEMCEMIFVFMNGSRDAACAPVESSDGVLDVE